MNTKEKAIAALLSRMRDEYGVVGVKAEFEAEGTRFEELIRLKEIITRCDLELTLKIGGAEDVWGILQAVRIGVHEIVAPMVESPYAVKKFLEAAGKHVPSDEQHDIALAVNIETEVAALCIEEILDYGKERGLQGVTVGRVDYVGSLGMERTEIDGPCILAKVRRVLSLAKNKGMHTAVGGGIELGSKGFLKSIADEGILDYFETRKVVFESGKGLASFEAAIRDAHTFELLWLENKRAFYHAIAEEDARRIPMLHARIKALSGKEA